MRIKALLSLKTLKSAKAMVTRDMPECASSAEQSNRRVLVVDDDSDLSWGLCNSLGFNGHWVDAALTGADGLERHRAWRPHLILLDLHLPDIDGIEVLKRIRADDLNVRVLVISGRTAPSNREEAFESGADDYLIKPFGPAELLARVGNQLLRYSSARCREEATALKLDAANCAVVVRGRSIQLSPKQFAVLQRLLAARGKCVSREDIYHDVFGYVSVPESHTLDQHISALRKALSEECDGEPVIRTARGVGYSINEHFF